MLPFAKLLPELITRNEMKGKTVPGKLSIIIIFSGERIIYFSEAIMYVINRSH